MSKPACPVVLHPRQREILERLGRSRKLERRLAERVQIVLGSADGKRSVDQASAMRHYEQFVQDTKRVLETLAGQFQKRAA